MEINSGKDIYSKERTTGFVPYITATASNNGIGYFVGNKNKTFENHCISVNRNGSVGYAFYHNYPVLYGNDTRKLRPKFKNKYVSLFLTRIITNQKDKYGYGYKMGTGRLKRQKKMLPVNRKNEIDYKYMKSYIQLNQIIEMYNILKKIRK